MKLNERVTLIFENEDGDRREIQLTLESVLERTADDLYEDLHVCSGSGCNTEYQNFCDCISTPDDYVITGVIFQ